MDRIATLSVVDPDHNQPSASRRPTDYLVRRATGKLYLKPTGVVKRFFNLRCRNLSFGMIGTEMPAIGSVPEDPPIVHPFSIDEMDGRTDNGSLLGRP
jgi:hypothetical protein